MPAVGDEFARDPELHMHSEAVGSAMALETIMTSHKFKVGEAVAFHPARLAMPASPHEYKIVRLLPAEGGDPLYRIRSAAEPFDRVAKERELSHMTQ